jgi:hypothetical protein
MQDELRGHIATFRETLMDLSETQSRQQLMISATMLIESLKATARSILGQYTQRIILAAEGFLNSQSVDRAEVMERINKFISDGQQWIGVLMGLLSQTIPNTNIDLNRAVFSKQLTQDDASAIRKGGNSMTLHTQFAIFSLANGVILDGYLREQSQTNARLSKLAIAVIDDATTETCTKAHRQVKPVGAPFVLSGRPRFAKRIMMPPFHWHCRTSAVIVRSKREQTLLLEQLEVN